MATPSKEEFQEAIRALSAPLSEYEMACFVPDIFGDEEPSFEAKEYIGKALYQQWEMQKKAMELPAVQWLAKDRFVGRAFSALTKRVGMLSSAEATTDIYARVHRRLTDISMHWGKCNSEVQEALDDYSPASTLFFLSVLPAFHEYFHHPGAVPILMKQQKKLEELVRGAAAGDAALRELALLSVSSRADSDNHQVVAERLIAHRTRSIDKMRRAVVESFVPIERNDKTARERLLLYRLWRGIKLAFGRVSPAAIKNLLLVEGVENPLDDRNTDAMLKRFSSHMRPSYRHTRPYLFEEARGYNYREVMQQQGLEKALAFDMAKRKAEVT